VGTANVLVSAVNLERPEGGDQVTDSSSRERPDLAIRRPASADEGLAEPDVPAGRGRAGGDGRESGTMMLGRVSRSERAEVRTSPAYAGALEGVTRTRVNRRAAASLIRGRRRRVVGRVETSCGQRPLSTARRFRADPVRTGTRPWRGAPGPGRRPAEREPAQAQRVGHDGHRDRAIGRGGEDRVQGASRWIG